MPRSASFFSITLPTPGIFATGSGVRNASTCDGRTTNTTSGLSQYEAILARNLLGATQAEAVRAVSSRTCTRIASAAAHALGEVIFGSDPLGQTQSVIRGLSSSWWVSADLCSGLEHSH